MSANQAPSIPATPENLAQAIAKVFFERRGGHSEAHISQIELTNLLAETIRLYQRVGESKNA